MAGAADTADDSQLGRHLIQAIAAVFAALWLYSTAVAAPVPDARSKVFEPRHAQRIITLAPHIGELVAAVGAAPRIVAVSRFTDYPPQLASRAVIGDSAKLDIERIVTLKPDLIIAWLSGNSPAEVAQLERLGFPVFVTESRRLADIPQTLRQLGALIDANGAAPARAFEAAIARYRKQQRTPRLSVFYQLWPQPLMTINGKHWVSDVISLCGGDNIFAALAPLAPTVSLESVLQKNPDVILAGGAAEQFEAWRRFPLLNAVKRNALYSVEADDLHRPTLRLLDAVESVCRILDQARAGSTR